MYAILRVVGSGPAEAASESLGRDLAAALGVPFPVSRFRGDGVSLQLAGAAWGDIRAHLLQQIPRLAVHTRRAREDGLAVVIDVTIDGEDLGRRAYTSVPVDLELLDALQAARVALEFTVYPGSGDRSTAEGR